MGRLFFVLILTCFLITCGRSEKLEPVRNTNAPPVIQSATILPENPTVERDLAVAIQAEDPDQDAITFTYQWIKNDKEMVGETTHVLKKGSFKKGDVLQIKVIPSDGKTNGKPFLSEPVRILNTPPQLQEVIIDPRIPTSSDDLKAIVKAYDPDGDFVYYTFRWEKNGTPIPEEDKEILKRNRFKKGDSIVVVVTPDDREAVGSSKRSEAVTISNSPPLIISSPPTSVTKSTYVYQVKANDPDGDPVTFHLKSAPKGMEIERATGLIRWEIRKEDRGTHQIEIEATDPEEAKSIQKYTLIVDFKPIQ